MRRLPSHAYTPAQVAALDRRAIEDCGIPGATLMTRAGTAAFATLRRRWPRARRVVAVCGAGNNAGDGYVIAGLAAQSGLDARVQALVPPSRLSGDAALMARAWGGDAAVLDLDAGALAEADVIVDALLGTGLDRPVAGRFAAAVNAINASSAAVLAVDIPSGLSGLTGARAGVAVRADVTVTFIGLKQGLFTGDACECTGELLFADLGVAAHEPAEPAPVTLCGPADLAGLLKPRGRGAHKGHFGHVLVAGGDHGMGGAARMAAEAAARAGGGLVSVATRNAHVPGLPGARPELMGTGVDDPEDVEALLDRATVVALGPGLGHRDWGRELYRRVLARRLPLVLDADGLNLLAEDPANRDDWILTPHPGEAGRLLGTDTAAVQADRFEAVRALVRRYGGVAVLKGAGTLVSDGARVVACRGGNPGMASGGMGDVLTGVVAGLLAQGLPAFDAAVAGVLAHAAAADRAAIGGERGLLAGDVLARLRGVVNP